MIVSSIIFYGTQQITSFESAMIVNWAVCFVVKAFVASGKTLPTSFFCQLVSLWSNLDVIVGIEQKCIGMICLLSGG